MTVTLRSRVFDSGGPISGTWHRRTFHPWSFENLGMGRADFLWAAVLPWYSCAALTRSSSVALV
eukprot:112321-Pleurochrysis_carterae.AAC.1